MTGNKNAPCSGQADTAREESKTDSRYSQTISSKRTKCYNRCTAYRVTPSLGASFRIVVSSRDRWALGQLRKAGAEGCPPIHNPAPSCAAYAYDLRALGVEIETITEPHEGEFPGTHARYVLRSGVSLGWKGGAA